MLVISPHLDDAVFSCGNRIAANPGTTVLTVLAGVPEGAEKVTTDWDRRCSFPNAAEAMHARLAEDRAALAVLGARPLWLGGIDAQYAPTPGIPVDAESLACAMAPFEGNEVLIPLGLFHADHLRVHAAAWDALERLGWPMKHVLHYEDAIYRSMPGVLVGRLAALQQAGRTLLRVEESTGFEGLKQRAAAQYASQLRPFSEDALADLERPETYWRVLDAPSTSRGLRKLQFPPPTIPSGTAGIS